MICIYNHIIIIGIFQKNYWQKKIKDYILSVYLYVLLLKNKIYDVV